MRFGIPSRYEKTLRQDIDARRAVPAPHRHGLHLGRILRIGGEVVAQSRQVLNVVGNALAVDAVAVDRQHAGQIDAGARLHAPTQQGGIVPRGGIVQIEIAHDARHAEMAVAFGPPGILEIDRKIGHALRNRIERLAERAAHAGQLGRQTEFQMIVRKGNFVADHRGEGEVIGVRPLEVDRRGACVEIAEGRHVAAEGKALERHVGFAQARRIAALRTAAEVGGDIDYDTAQRTGVGDTFKIDALPRSVIARNRNRRRDEVGGRRRSVEVVTGTQGDEPSECQRILVLFVREEELRPPGLLETGAVRLVVIVDGVHHRHPVTGRTSSPLAGNERIGLLNRDHVNRRRTSVPGGGCVRLRRSRNSQEQRNDEKSNCLHKLLCVFLI